MSTIIIICAIIFAVSGIVMFFYFGFLEFKWYGYFFGILLFFVGIIVIGLGIFVENLTYTENLAYYLPVESLAHNQTQTIFATEEGIYTVNSLYPDGTYLLTVDGKDVLAVWQAVDGEVR